MRLALAASFAFSILFSPLLSAEIIVNSQQVNVQASAGALNGFDIPVDDFEFRNDSSLFDSFSASVTAVAAGDAIPLEGEGFVSNAGDAGAQSNITVSRSPSEVQIDGSFSLSAAGSLSPSLPLRANVGGGADAFFSIEVRITDRPARFRFEMISQSATASGLAASVNSGARVFFGPPVGIASGGTSCNERECVANPPFVQTRQLSPGTHSFLVSLSTAAIPRANTVQANASCAFTLSISDSECDLTWNEFGGGGLFSDAANWSPQQSPTDDETGCNNLLVDRNGVFTIGFSNLQTANRLEFAGGAPTLRSVSDGVLLLSNSTNAEGSSGFIVSGNTEARIDGLKVDANGVEVGGGLGNRAVLRVSGAASRIRSRGLTGDDVSDKALRVAGLQDGQLDIENGAQVGAGRVVLGVSRGLDETLTGLIQVRGGAPEGPSLLTVTEELQIGSIAEGILRIEEGGQLVTTNSAPVNVGSFQSGELSVSGINAVNNAPSQATVDGRIVVGGSTAPNASVFVSEGARMDAEDVSVGTAGPGVFFIDKGARVNLDGSFTLDAGHNSLLDMSSGAVLLLGGSLQVGLGDGTGGRAIIQGDTGGDLTRLTAVSVIVGGRFGRGVLEISGNSNVEATSLFVPRLSEDNEPGNGTVRLSDGALASFLRDVVIGDQGPGVVSLSGASVLTAEEVVEVGAQGRLELASLSTVISPSVQVLAPGAKLVGIRATNKQGENGPGRIEGDLQLGAGATLSLETDQSGAPALEITGNFEAAGALELVFPPDVALAAGQVLTLFTVGGTNSGAFEAVSSPSRSEDFRGSVQFEEGQVSVLIEEPGVPVNGSEGEGEGEGTAEGQPEGEGEVEGADEGEPEGEGEGEDGGEPPVGCNCNNDSKMLPLIERGADLLTYFFSLSLLLGASLFYRSRQTV